MRGAAIVHDGLWRCLCPGVDARMLQRAITNIPLPRPRQRRRHSPSGRRTYGAATGAAAYDSVVSSGPSPSERLLESRALSRRALANSTPEDIRNALNELRDPAGWTPMGPPINRAHRAEALLQHLLSRPDAKLDADAYECMMATMAHPVGSAAGVRKLFRDMAEQHLVPTPAMCHSALVALAAHPSHVVRGQVLETMGRHGIEVGEQGRQYIVLGMLRDQQYEMAYERLQTMLDEGVQIEPWVYDIFIVVLGQLGFHDEMLSLLVRCSEGKDDIENLIHYALDTCSQAFHLAGTTYAWGAVAEGVLHPSDGIVENVLDTATRHGDVELATDALEILANRASIKGHHYEATAEAFARKGDVENAIRIYCIMKRGGHAVRPETTVPFSHALRHDKDRLEVAELAIQELKDIPVAVVCAVLAAKAELHGTESATFQYREAKALCGEVVPLSSVQDMLAHAQEPSTVETLIMDYRNLLAADAEDALRMPEVYDKLMPKLLSGNGTDPEAHFDLAMRVAAQSAGAREGQGEAPAWVEELAERAIAKEDGELWALVDEFEKRGDGSVVAVINEALSKAKLKGGARLSDPTTS